MAYAYPVGATSDSGVVKGVTKQITAANTLVTIFTATKKTKVLSAIVSNSLGTIVPVQLYVYRDVDEVDYFVSKSRVLKSKPMVLALISGDNRTTESPVSPTSNRISTELILEIGDAIKASCPIEDVVNLTLEVKEGVK